jgi:AraC-like DNA-binding protein
MPISPTPGSAAWPAAMIVWGPGFVSTPHRHHCVQLVMTLAGTLRVRGGPTEPWRRCGAALVRPDAQHEVDAREGTVLIAFIEAESELGAALCDEIRGDIAAVNPHRVARWRETLRERPSQASVVQWLNDYLLQRRRAVELDARVQRVVRHVRSRLASGDSLSLKSLAVVAGMSSGRFMHLFTQSLGVPVRPYIRWLRLQLAACELMDGATASMAAHRAGFSDAAHMTRTFRNMLGTTPSDLAMRKRLATGVPVEARAPKISLTGATFETI